VLVGSAFLAADQTPPAWWPDAAWWSNVQANIGVALFVAVPVTWLGLALSARVDVAEDKADAAEHRAEAAEERVAAATQSFQDALAELKSERRERHAENEEIYKDAVADPSPATIYDALNTAWEEGILTDDGLRVPVVTAGADLDGRWYLRFAVEGEFVVVFLGGSSRNDQVIAESRHEGAIKDLLSEVESALRKRGLVVSHDGDDLLSAVAVKRLGQFFPEVAHLRKTSEPEQRRLFTGIVQLDDLPSPDSPDETETWYFTTTSAIPVHQPDKYLTPGPGEYARAPKDKHLAWLEKMRTDGVHTTGIALSIAESLDMGVARRRSL